MNVMSLQGFTFGFSMHGVLHVAHLIPILGLVLGEPASEHLGLGCWRERLRARAAVPGGG